MQERATESVISLLNLLLSMRFVPEHCDGDGDGDGDGETVSMGRECDFFIFAGVES